jgi:hypothetical protein
MGFWHRRKKEKPYNNKNDVIKELSSCIFWDMDISKLDVDEDKEIIIERVLTRGFEKDEILLWKIYSRKTIKKTVVNSEELNDSTISYLSIVLNIKEKKFKCYKKKQYHLNYWKE